MTPKTTGLGPAGRTVDITMHDARDTKHEARGTRHSDEPLPADLRETLVRLVSEHGERGAAARAGVAKTTLARALAGLPIARGTRALMREKLGGGGRA